MISFFISSIKIIFVLGFLILIHEGGHFLVAKICKVTVNEFSIGFGPVIWQKQGKQTKYTLRLIPLGGFVNLEGEEERSDNEGSFSKASIPKRMAIVLAGGMVNILFALVTYYILMVCVGNYTSFVVDSTIPNYAAQTSGIEAGDRILKVNQKTMHTKNDLDKIMQQIEGRNLILTIERNGEQKEMEITPTKEEVRNTGIYLKGLSAGESTKILTVGAGSNAEKQGVRANDEIVKINGKEVKNQTEIVEIINQEENTSFVLTVQRGNEQLEITIEPEIVNQYYLGIYFKTAEKTLSNRLSYSFFETRDFTFSIFENLKMLVTGKVRVDQFMGPVGISEVVASTSGIADFVNILALISLSLGVTNLLPIPALDGGKFLLLFIEAIRRKKLSEKIEINIQLIGFAFLIVLSIYIAYHDILRIL